MYQFSFDAFIQLGRATRNSTLQVIEHVQKVERVQRAVGNKASAEGWDRARKSKHQQTKTKKQKIHPVAAIKKYTEGRGN